MCESAPSAWSKPASCWATAVNLAGRVTVKSGTVLGRDNLVLEGTVLGGMPQHIHMPEHPGTTEIGDGNVFRENCTVHRALEAGHVTRIGNRCLFMVGAHVAHDCIVDDNVVLTNGTMLGGHVEVGDKAYIGGAVAVHQFCRIGRLAMIGGMCPRDPRRAAVRHARRRHGDGRRPEQSGPPPRRLHRQRDRAS